MTRYFEKWAWSFLIRHVSHPQTLTFNSLCFCRTWWFGLQLFLSSHRKVVEYVNGLLSSIVTSALATGALTYELPLPDLQRHVVYAWEARVVIPEGKKPRYFMSKAGSLMNYVSAKITTATSNGQSYKKFKNKVLQDWKNQFWSTDQVTRESELSFKTSKSTYLQHKLLLLFFDSVEPKLI